MKENTTDSPEKLIQCFTEGDDWAAAKWAATVFSYDPAGLPEIGIAFEDLDAGKRIFNSWIERFGHIDKHEELRVSIIQRYHQSPMKKSRDATPTRAARCQQVARLSRNDAVRNHE